MTTSNHALTGAALATLVKQPVLALPLAFASHFVCDGLPHFDVKFNFGSKKMWLYLVGDGIVALLLAIYLLSRGVHNPVYLAIVGFTAMSPDLVWLYYGLKKTVDPKEYGPISRLHHALQWGASELGILFEIPWALLMISVIFRYQ